MKLLIYTDPHLSTNSSIIVGKMESQKRERFSARLDRCISTFEWINQSAKDYKVDQIICLGDLVDQPKLNAEELSAISESKIESHKILVGNHDVSSVDGYFNSCNLYGNAIREFKIDRLGDTSIVYLPWSRDLIDLSKELEGCDPNKTIILSHNDIKGIFYGNYKSTSGYDIPDILRSCKLFINGHIHTGSWIQKGRIMNLGTITGLNFNNVNGWSGYAVIVDTDTFKLTWLENPYAFVFKDQRILSRSQLGDFFSTLDDNKCNIVQLRVPKSLVEVTRSSIENHKSIAFSRILTLYDKTDENIDNLDPSDRENLDLEINIYDSLRAYVKENCPSKYDLNSVLDEINKLEAMI